MRDWLKYTAKEEQLDFFEKQGYLLIEDALSTDQVTALEAVIDRIDVCERKLSGIGANQVMQKFRVVAEDDLFLELLDNEKVFPLAWDILGWNIQHYISHVIVSPPDLTDLSTKKDRGWHQDGGRPVVEMERPHPRLSFKVSFWISDTRGDDRGGMLIVPGSHRLDSRPPPEAIEDAMQIQVSPGTAVLFDRRMWHARGSNTSSHTRKVVFVGYSYRWLRGLDYNSMPNDLLDRCDPIRRQLLGDGVDVKGWWQPTEEDVPLRTWILEHRGDSFLGDSNVFKKIIPQ